MVLAGWHGRGGRRVLQAAGAPGRGAWRGLLVLGCLAPIGLGGCGGPNDNIAPVDWWHHLEGGELARERPPPPGAELPYPKVFTVPAKPTAPSAAFRQTVQGELVTDRDTTERMAAHTPIDLNAVPPPPPKPPAAPAAPSDDTANATLPAADAPPPPKAAAPPAPAAPVLTMAGAPPDEASLPQVPDSPPPPPAFEEVAPPPPPAPLPTVARFVPGTGTAIVLFATGDATLNPSQNDALKDAIGHRGKGVIAIEGHGEAAGDTPGAQQQAVELGLRRAASIAAALGKMHVPADKMILSATAFGRDAVVRDQ